MSREPTAGQAIQFLGALVVLVGAVWMLSISPTSLLSGRTHELRRPEVAWALTLVYFLIVVVMAALLYDAVSHPCKDRRNIHRDGRRW